MSLLGLVSILLVLYKPAIGDQGKRSLRVDEVSKLLSRMSPDERPPGSPTNVFVNFDLLHLHSVDASEKTMDITFRLQLKWNDARMARYQAYDHNRLVISPDKVWTPDVTVLNAIRPLGRIYDGHVTYTSTGEATLVRVIHVTASGQLLYALYELEPFWLLSLGSWTYNSDEQRLKMADYEQGSGMDKKSRKWNISFQELINEPFTIDGMEFDAILLRVNIHA